MNSEVYALVFVVALVLFGVFFFFSAKRNNEAFGTKHVVMAFAFSGLATGAGLALGHQCQDQTSECVAIQANGGVNSALHLRGISSTSEIFEGRQFTLVDNVRTGPTSGEAVVNVDGPLNQAYLRDFKVSMINLKTNSEDPTVPVGLFAYVNRAHPQTVYSNLTTFSKQVDNATGKVVDVPSTVSIFDHVDLTGNFYPDWVGVDDLKPSEKVLSLKIVSENMHPFISYDWVLEVTRGPNSVVVERFPWTYWNSSYTYQVRANQTFALSGALAKFQLPFNFSCTTPVSTLKMYANMSDVNFVNGSDNTNFNRYFENSTNNTGNCVAWVGVDYVVNGQNNYSYYYGNNGSNVAFSSPYKTTYDPNVTFWQDFSEHSDMLTIKSGDNPSNNLTCTNAVSHFDAAVYGYGFNATTTVNPLCTAGSALSTYITSNNVFTIEVVGKMQADILNNAGVTRYNLMGDNNGYFAFVDGGLNGGTTLNATSAAWYMADAGNKECVFTGLTVGKWYHFVGVSNSTSYVCYLNGVQVGYGLWTGFGSTAGTLYFAGANTGTPRGSEPFLVDSEAIWKQSQSADWAKARYQALLNSSWGFGPEVQNLALPTMVLNYPADAGGQTNNTVVFNVTATKGSNPLGNVTIYTNRTGSWVANKTNSSVLTSGSSTAITVAGIPDSVFGWTALACDNVGNCAFSATNFTYEVDTTAPTNETFVSPTLANGSTTANNYLQTNFTFNAIAPTSCSFTFNSTLTSGTISSFLGLNNYSCFTNSTSLSDGGYYGRGTATDLFGSTNTTVLYFVVDTSAPSSLAFVSPSPANQAYVNVSYIYYNLTFSEVNPDSCTLSVNGTNYSMTRSGTNCFYNNTGLVDGKQYTANVTVNDTFAHAAISSNLVNRVDLTAPTITLVVPINGSVPGQQVAITINVSATDGFAGLNNSRTNDSAWASSYSPTGNAFNLTNSTAISSAIHTVLIRVNDSAGNTQYASVSFDERNLTFYIAYGPPGTSKLNVTCNYNGTAGGDYGHLKVPTNQTNTQGIFNLTNGPSNVTLTVSLNASLSGYSVFMNTTNNGTLAPVTSTSNGTLRSSWASTNATQAFVWVNCTNQSAQTYQISPAVKFKFYSS